MAGRGCDRSRPAKKKHLKRRKYEDDDEIDDTDGETENHFHRERQTKRKRTETSPHICAVFDNFGLHPYSLIVNGNPASKGRFPYQVALQFTRSNGDIARGGGSIIANQWILTAAHLCKDARKAVVLAGAFPTLNDAEQTAEADLIVMQDAYRTDNVFSRFILHDIALLRLKNPLKYTDQVKAINLPPKSKLECDFSGNIGILTGWGKTGDTDDNPLQDKAMLYYAYEKILSNRKAAEMLQVDELPSTILAAIGNNGKGCSCNGDSGGPLMLQGERGEPIVVGVISHRVGKCGGPLPHLLTRVTSYVGWITKITHSCLKDKNAH